MVTCAGLSLLSSSSRMAWNQQRPHITLSPPLDHVMLNHQMYDQLRRYHMKDSSRRYTWSLSLHTTFPHFHSSSLFLLSPLAPPPPPAFTPSFLSIPFSTYEGKLNHFILSHLPLSHKHTYSVQCTCLLPFFLSLPTCTFETRESRLCWNLIFLSDLHDHANTPLLVDRELEIHKYLHLVVHNTSP